MNPSPSGPSKSAQRWQVVAPALLRPSLFARRKHWAKRFGPAGILPMSRDEMEALGWDACDVILVTGDAYVDHPSFGAALIGRVLEEQGFRVGILAQPPWRSADAFAALGAPAVMFGVTAGNMDSMVNHYTSERRIRSDDAYSPDGRAGLRPDRAAIVYAQRCREAFPDVPVVLGGIEASLRRAAHFDYWSEKVRRSLLLDAKADLLVFGNGERQVVEIAHRLAAREPLAQLADVRGTACARPAGFQPDGYTLIDARAPEARLSAAGPAPQAVRLPSFEAVARSPLLYAHASRVLHLESNPGNARPLVQRHGDRDVWLNPPALPLPTEDLDAIYELPFSRRPHPGYGGRPIPAYEMIKASVSILRGCFGGCTFCSLTEHEGRIIQSRSAASVLREIEAVRDRTPGFSGVISDLGGPTANMYRQGCRTPAIEAACRRLSCLYPAICPNLDTSHAALIELYRHARRVRGVKKITIGSGIRFDLAVRSPEYVAELARHHVGGYLKIAPEHTQPGPLGKMQKPGVGSYERFRAMFDRFSRQAGKEQYLVPYFMAAHPGTTDADMVALALWCKRNGFRPDQVQVFLPAPMALATAMYHSGHDPLARLDRGAPPTVPVSKGTAKRKLQKAFLRYHDPENWPMLRRALARLGRRDLIGHGRACLMPPELPRPKARAGTRRKARSGRSG
ncbi:MAG: YgiQ family radical SAM protein [Deltaproteobacteria bacterium]|nr:YgiQ family radical SAM protein [Deltaproteobacteria bacterium]